MPEKKLISVNFSKSQNKKLGVVIHTMVGSLNGTNAWFNNPASGVSAHYGVDLDGSRVFQWVEENHIAYAQGIVSKPTFKLVTERPGENPNNFLISIECADDGDPASADRSKQYPVLIELVKDICKRNNIPIDRDHIAAHREIRSTKTCPGNLDVDYIVREAAKQPESSQNDWNGVLSHFKVKDAKELTEMVDKELGFLKSAREKVSELELNIVAEKDGHTATKQKHDLFIKQVSQLLGSPGDEQSIIMFASKFNSLTADYEKTKIEYEHQEEKHKAELDEKQSELTQLRAELEQLHRQVERLETRVNEAISEKEAIQEALITSTKFASFWKWLAVLTRK